MTGPVGSVHASRSLPADLRALARGGATNLVAAGGNAVFTFALFVVAARLYPPAEVGAFLIAVAVFTILVTTAQSGAQVGFVRFIAHDLAVGRADRLRSTLRAGLVPVLVIGALAAVAVVATAPLLADLFGGGRDGALAARHLRLLAPVIPIAAAFLAMASATQGFGTMVPAAVTDRLGRTGAQLALVAATAAFGPVALAVSWGLPYVAGAVVMGLWLLRLLTRAEAAHGARRDHGDEPSWSRFWRFTGPRGVASVFQVAVLWIDTILLGALRSTAEAGVYSIATRYLTIGHLAIGAVLQVVGPRLSAILADGDEDRARSLFRTATWWAVSLVWPLYLTLAIFHRPLLEVFGTEYVRAGPAVVVLAVAMLLAVACGPVDVVLLMSGRSWLSLTNWGLALALNLGLNLWLIPRYGILGAAVAWMASIVVRNAVPLWQVHAQLRLDPFGSGHLRATGAAVGCFGLIGLASRSLVGETWPALCVSLLVAGPVYLGLLWRWRGSLYARVPAAAGAADG